MRTLALVGTLLIFEVAAAAAPATPISTDRLIERGIEFRAQGKPAEALDLFEKADARASSARARAQIGLAKMSLHRWLEAEADIQAALARHDSEWIENQTTREALEKSLAAIELHVSKVRIEGTVGADVVVDGKLAGRLPLVDPVHTNPGILKVRASAQGRQTVEIEVAGVAGEEVVASVELAPLPAEALEPSPTLPALALAEPPVGAPRWRKTTGIILIGAGAVALATGIVWLNLDGKGGCDTASGGICNRLYDTALRGWIAASAGVALAATGAGLVLWKGQHDVRVALGHNAAFVMGRF